MAGPLQTPYIKPKVPAPQPVLGQANSSGTGPMTPAPTALQQNNASLIASVTDPSAPNYRGPGWEVKGYDDAGAVIVGRSADPGKQQAQNQFELAPKPAVPTLNDLNAALAPPAQPAAPLTIAQQFAAAPGVGSQGYVQLGAPQRQAVAPTAPRPAASLFPTVPLGTSAPTAPASAATSANPEASGPAEVDRSKIDALLGNVSKANSGILGLAENDAHYSAAQAQLAQGIAQTQANTLALSRSGNRRDAAALGAQALQRNVELGGEASRSAAALRAQEEDANKRLKLDAYKTAGDLGLNTAALEVDVNNLNMQAATSYLNNLFETNRLGLQLDEAEATRVTNFVRDMALVAKDYYALDMAERQSFRDDLTRRYGISETTKAAMAQLDAQPGFWEQAALGLIGGAGQGASAGAMALISDERLKTDVADTTDAELDELLGKFQSKTYAYTGERAKQGRQFGGMAQALRSSALGSGMVDQTTDGTLVVDGAKAGMAALSTLSKVWGKLKALEAAL